MRENGTGNRPEPCRDTDQRPPCAFAFVVTRFEVGEPAIDTFGNGLDFRQAVFHCVQPALHSAKIPVQIGVVQLAHGQITLYRNPVPSGAAEGLLTRILTENGTFWVISKPPELSDTPELSVLIGALPIVSSVVQAVRLLL